MIRAAMTTDADAIAAVHEASRLAAYRGLMDDALAIGDRARRRVMWAGLVAPGNGRVLVAADGDVLVAFVHVAPSRDDDASADVGEITSLYVQPSHWRRGIGRDLMTAALRHARDSGLATVTLWVLEANARARAFYEAAGFARDGGQKVHAPTGLQEMRYRRQIEAQDGA